MTKLETWYPTERKLIDALVEAGAIHDGERWRLNGHRISWLEDKSGRNRGWTWGYY